MMFVKYFKQDPVQ